MRILRKITDAFWWDVARACPYTTFFHTPIWREMIERAFPGRYRDETFGVILPSGVRVVFPLASARRLGPIRWLISTIEGGYGGFIADGPVSSAEAAQIYRQVCGWSTYSFSMTDNPLGHTVPAEIQPGFTLLMREDAYKIELNTDFDSIFARFSRTQRNAYRSGLKKGVQVRLATSLDDYRAYYTNYRDAIDRWGGDESSGYGWDIFEQAYWLSQSYPDQIKLWLMIFDEQIVGGRIVFYWGQQATGWNGTAHRDYLKYNVMPVTDTEIIRDAAVRGIPYFDLSTSDLRQGVISYKQRFRPEGVPVSVWHYEHPLITRARALYQRVRRRPAPQASPAPTTTPERQPEAG